MQQAAGLLRGGGALQVHAVGHPFGQVRAVVPGRSGDRDAFFFQMAARDRIRHLRDPGLERAVAAVLGQRLVHAQEGLLAQLAGVVGVAHHALDHMPAQALVVAHQALERPRLAGQHRGHQAPVGGDGLAGIDGNGGIAHGPWDTPGGAAVARPRAGRPVNCCNRRSRGRIPGRQDPSRPSRQATAMQFESFIPIVLFICILLAIRSVVEARTRRQMVQSHGSEEMLRALIEGEEARRREASLRWGVILLALAIGFGLIEALPWQEPSPGLFAILLAAAGLGNLAAYYLSRRAK